MPEPQKTVYVDEEIAAPVLATIRDAQKYVAIVTPYVELWGHVKDAIALAMKRGVKVTAVVRNDPEVLHGDSVAWLAENGVKLLAVTDLHAKIYLNELSVVVSSMNLSQYSSKNSKEIALVVRDKETGEQIRDYVANRVMRLAVPVTGTKSQHAGQPWGRPAKSQLGKSSGSCIRCGQQIPLNPSKPLCDTHFGHWAEWGNRYYPEDFCHSCGRPADVTYAKPLCRECFREQA